MYYNLLRKSGSLKRVKIVYFIDNFMESLEALRQFIINLGVKDIPPVEIPLEAVKQESQVNP